MFELYLMDLHPEKRKEFLEAYGCWDADVENPSTFPNNWDIFPIMVFDTDDVDFGSDLVDEYSYVVSILDDQNNPSDNLDNFGDINEAIAYAKEHQGAGVFHEVYLRDKEICEYELAWHPEQELNKAYQNYLRQWYADHSGPEFEGMEPVCFDEFIHNEYLEGGY